MSNKELFSDWLINQKGFTNRKRDKIISLYDMVNQILQSKAGDIDMFELDSTQEYLDMCTKYLSNNTEDRLFAKRIADFNKSRSLYADCLLDKEQKISFKDTAKIVDEAFDSLPGVENSEDIFTHDEPSPSEKGIDNVLDILFDDSELEDIFKFDGDNLEKKDVEQLSADDSEIVPSQDESAKAHRKSNSSIRQEGKEYYIKRISQECSDSAHKLVGHLNIEEKPLTGATSLCYDFATDSVNVISQDGDSIRQLDDYCIVNIREDEKSGAKDKNSTVCATRKLLKNDHNSILDYSRLMTTYGGIFQVNPEHTESLQYNILSKCIADTAHRYHINNSRMYCLIPDLLDDFNKVIRGQLQYNGARIFAIPRSVALSFYLQDIGKITVGDNYYIIDFDGETPSCTELSVNKSEDGKEDVIVRRGRRKLKNRDKYFGQDKVSEAYIQAYQQKHNIKLSKALVDNIIHTCAVSKLMRDKQDVLIKDGDNYFNLGFDQDAYNSASQKLIANLEQWEKEDRLNAKEYKVFCLFSGFKNFFGKEQLFAGAKIVQYRYENRLTLWKEYLPSLALEVFQEGTFTTIDLIDEKNSALDVLNVLDDIQVIQVDKRMALPAGAESYRLPLERDVYSKADEEKMAYIEPKSILTEDLEVRLEIEYQYDAENPYKLFFYPLNPEKYPYERLESEWRDIVLPECVNPPDYNPSDTTSTDENNDKLFSAFSIAKNNIWLAQTRNKRFDPKPNNITGRYSSMLGALHGAYKHRRMFFGQDINYINYRLPSYARDTINTMIALVTDPINDYILQKYECLKETIARILSDLGNIYQPQVIRQDRSGKLNALLRFYDIQPSEYKLKYLISISRMVSEYQSGGIFDKISQEIMHTRLTKGNMTSIGYFRTMSCNCWGCREWIENLYKSKDGDKAIKKLADYVMKYFLDFDLGNIKLSDKPSGDDVPSGCRADGYNPREVRDMQEVLLCLTRADSFNKANGKKFFFDINRDLVKDVVKKIKDIDRKISKFGNEGNLRYPYVCRLNQGDKSLAYMLVKALTGDEEEIQLITFTEEL